MSLFKNAFRGGEDVWDLSLREKCAGKIGVDKNERWAAALLWTVLTGFFSCAARNLMGEFETSRELTEDKVCLSMGKLYANLRMVPL